MLSNHFICYRLVDQGCIGCLRLDRASFIHLLSESVLSSTEGARHQATLWNHLSCPSKIISTTFFSTTGYGVSMDSTIRDWKLLGAFVTLLFITDLPSQWFKISLWTSEMKTVTVLPPPLSDPQEWILTRGEFGPFSLLLGEFLQHHQSLPLATGDWMLQRIRSSHFKGKCHLR